MRVRPKRNQFHFICFSNALSRKLGLLILGSVSLLENERDKMCTPTVGFSRILQHSYLQLRDTLSPGFPWFLAYTSVIRLVSEFLLATVTFVFSMLVSPARCQECRASAIRPHPEFFAVTLISGMLLIPSGLTLGSVLSIP